ncbi:hypothetical protein VZC37_15635 [Gordonia sp. LSe1-13]|uniref:Uncharacterized protein n=1 Tax=Gordonia sesuvii TaxID=3116777 RepID=A0ABU7MF91_9ACTN|nr:hypothetical protein [Gordonia sp. LSe1-13]
MQATAEAQPQNRTVLSGPIYSVADGPFCGGVINLLASPSPTRARTTYIQVSGGFYGISGSLAPCGVGVTVHWRNLRTGAKGAVHGRVSGTVVPFAGTLMYRYPVTGSGAVELTVQPHRPYLPKPPVRVQIP